MIIDIGDTRPVGIGLEQSVQPDDILRRFRIRDPEKPVARQEGTQNGCNSVAAGDLAHRPDTAHDILRGDPAVVPGDIVDAPQYHDRLGVMVDHVGLETGQHVFHRLATDAAA